MERLDVALRSLGGDRPASDMPLLSIPESHALQHVVAARLAMLIARQELGEDPECDEQTVYLVCAKTCDKGCPVTLAVRRTRAEAQEELARIAAEVPRRDYIIGEARL